MADGAATSEMSNDTYDANNYVVATPPVIVATQTRNSETPVDTSSVSTQVLVRFNVKLLPATAQINRNPARRGSSKYPSS
ncbi:hypothetical protein BC830DRAFT_577986 [Chytriomyces sp. MP71]|nr:hypothetical protein BC830DRAFT_577986 [Chytriomyces sp. MP71]